jgi:hypothetical protein
MQTMQDFEFPSNFTFQNFIFNIPPWSTLAAKLGFCSNTNISDPGAIMGQNPSIHSPTKKRSILSSERPKKNR